MARTQRAPERLYAVVMWIISIVFALFLAGLGGLVIRDLPKAADPPQIEAFHDQAAATEAAQLEASARAQRQDLSARIETAELGLAAARNAYQSEREAYDNWVAARIATTDPAQDPEVLARTRRLDVLKSAERQSEQFRERLAAEDLALSDLEERARAARATLDDAARPAFERARFVRELQVFGGRLAVTLPLLAVAALFLLRGRTHRYWPLMRGFVLFAAYAFFFELVPYLPDYGGYVRFGVGVILTLIASHFLITRMRAYLARREAAEARGEPDRRAAIRYDEALKKFSAKTCPGCDRGVTTVGETEADFCVHCGLRLFDRCPACETRKFAFFRYCMKCGTPAPEAVKG